MADENEHGKFSSTLKSAVDATKAKAKKFSDEADWVFGRRTARVLGFMVLFAVVVALSLVFLDLYIAPTKPGHKKDLVLALAQILAGTALLSGLYFTWRTLQVNREGQITERFTRAIDQLGSKELEIRLGGIYALERIARDSERDHWPIMEVLTAYVRQHAPWRPEEWRPEEGQPEEGQQGKPTEIPAPAPDIQAIMTILRRRTRSFRHGEPEQLDLRGTNLSGANLREANLSQADLSQATLSQADLWKADLSGATLSQADLSGATLSGANLTEADLRRADLWGAHLVVTTLSGASLAEANLTGASLWGANLTGASLWGANLTEAELLEANLTEANLSQANLSQADLTRASLTPAQLEETTGDTSTTLPSHLKPPAHWGGKTDEQIEGD